MWSGEGIGGSVGGGGPGQGHPRARSWGPEVQLPLAQAELPSELLTADMAGVLTPLGGQRYFQALGSAPMTAVLSMSPVLCGHWG